MYNSKPKSADKPEKIKKTFAFRPEVAELIETHKYVHRGREVDFVSQYANMRRVLTARRIRTC